MKKFRAIGLMSGTSIDGVDVALIETDGFNHVKPLAFEFFPYEDDFRDVLRSCFGKREGTKNEDVKAAEKLLTQKHTTAVHAFIKDNDIDPKTIDMIGFHGQTIWHDPAARETVQIGDGAMLAEMTGITVVNDFRSADVKAGGQGAPLAPFYHRALASNLPKPIAIINIGGVSNISWVSGSGDEDILAFDMGVGNALLDDWMMLQKGLPYDKDGALAETGTVNDAFVSRYMTDPYFEKMPPKSLDRDAFTSFVPKDMKPEDGAATLTMMSVKAIAHGLAQLPDKPKALYITGGGRRNKVMMEWLEKGTGIAVHNVEELGWKGDALEAEAFAYLAVRSFLELPISLPQTTSAPTSLTGGQVYKTQ